MEISSNAQLSEIRDVTFYQDGRVEVSSTEWQQQTGTGRHRKVTINFPSNTNVAYNETLNVPVPILPVVSGKTLTITATGTFQGNGDTKTFTKTITLTQPINRNDYWTGSLTQINTINLNTGEGFSSGGGTTI